MLDDEKRENPVVGENLVVGEFVRECQRSHFWPFQGHRSLFEGDRATLANRNHSGGNNSNWRCSSGKRVHPDSSWRMEVPQEKEGMMELPLERAPQEQEGMMELPLERTEGAVGI